MILTQRTMRDCTIQIHQTDAAVGDPFGWYCVVHETGATTATEEEAREGARTHIEGYAQ